MSQQAIESIVLLQQFMHMYVTTTICPAFDIYFTGKQKRKVDSCVLYSISEVHIITIATKTT